MTMDEVKASVLAEIRTKYNLLSPVQKRVAEYVLNNSEKVILLSISELAQECDTSETSVVRFLRKLGFNSYQVFRVKIAQEISNTSTQAIYNDIKPDDNVSQIKKKVIISTVNSINDINKLLDDRLVERTVELFLNAERILFFGVGASGIIAKDAFHKFSRLGLNTISLNDSHMINILSTHTKPEDVLFVVSHSGESREIIDCVELAKDNGTSIVLMTSYAHSTLSRYADIVLLSSTNETRYRSDAMVSRIIQLVIIDIIYVAFVLKSGAASIKKLNKSRLAVAKRKV